MNCLNVHYISFSIKRSKKYFEKRKRNSLVKQRNSSFSITFKIISSKLRINPVIKFSDFRVICNSFFVNIFYMAEQAMFNGVPFGTLGWVMAYYNGQSCLSGKFHEPVFENKMPVRICPSCITQEQDIFSIGILVYSIFPPPPKQIV
jgi:hypothetical protein